MTHLRMLATFAVVALLPACTDYATFVTATNIGINADVKTQDVSIGYGRAELFTGPGYPEQGEAPRAVGYINSDLHVFEPHIKQLYATGDAAELVTLPESMLPRPKQPPETLPVPAYEGQRRPLVFATGANVGLKVGFGAGTAPVPSSIKLGYNREEASIIPMRREQPVEGKEDKYAPVLASMDMDLKTAGETASTNLGITQFFATGSAARNLASYDYDIRGYFKLQAREAVKAASLSGTYSFDASSEKLRAFWKPTNDIVNPDNDTRIKNCMAKYNLQGSVPFLIYGRTKPERDVVGSCLGI